MFLRFNYGARYLRFFVAIVVCCYDQSDTGIKKNFMSRMYNGIMIDDGNDSSDIDTINIDTIIWFVVQTHLDIITTILYDNAYIFPFSI